MGWSPTLGIFPSYGNPNYNWPEVPGLYFKLVFHFGGAGGRTRFEGLPEGSEVTDMVNEVLASGVVTPRHNDEKGPLPRLQTIPTQCCHTFHIPPNPRVMLGCSEGPLRSKSHRIEGSSHPHSNLKSIYELLIKGCSRGNAREIQFSLE